MKTPSPSAFWCDYFRANAQALHAIPWEQGGVLTDAERWAITTSIQGFQLGESSEGRNFLNAARRYAEASGDERYIEALRLFIGEEQRHARDLGRFMDLAGIPRIAHTWPDTVFRWLRRGANLEQTIAVLVTAELFALVYYAALHEATGSGVLRTLCAQILRDEVEHVRFQTERLALLRQRWPRGWIWVTHGLHRVLFGGTCFVVWWKHGRTLHAGGYGWRRFWRAAWRELRVALTLMDPRNYRLGTVLPRHVTASTIPDRAQA